ncbi:Lipase-like pad4 [Datura stramonium]|uniref:Lipase-like pad4 n=1 Tax=Datura stramonium TaxID=4076 RepID=A0ABS8WYE9_DATST|nr:Lipase-like pad4 [Datura stramonium]
MENRSFMGGNLPESSYEAGITLALESLGIASHVRRKRVLEVRAEADARKFIEMLEDITKFDQYARRLIENKEVSLDVLAKNSSY